MTPIKDWMHVVVADIAPKLPAVPQPRLQHEDKFAWKTDWRTPFVIAALRKHFDDRVAYMPVPRCDGCKKWTRDENYPGQGQCTEMFRGTDAKMWPDQGGDINTTADFGCVQWEAK